MVGELVELVALSSGKGHAASTISGVIERDPGFAPIQSTLAKPSFPKCGLVLVPSGSRMIRATPAMPGSLPLNWFTTTRFNRRSARVRSYTQGSRR